MTALAAGLPRSEDMVGATVFAFDMRGWKRVVFRNYFRETRFRYVLQRQLDEASLSRWMRQIETCAKPVIFGWSVGVPASVVDFADQNRVPIFFIEDGFLRSLLPNASRRAPFSLSFDRQRPYFDSRGPSDLENLLEAYGFTSDKMLLPRARKAMDDLLGSRISKYNGPGQGSRSSMLIQSGDRRLVLVIGQVEDDASIEFGCDRPVTNNDLVRLAASETPAAKSSTGRPRMV